MYDDNLNSRHLRSTVINIADPYFVIRYNKEENTLIGKREFLISSRKCMVFLYVAADLII